MGPLFVFPGSFSSTFNQSRREGSLKADTRVFSSYRPSVAHRKQLSLSLHSHTSCAATDKPNYNKDKNQLRNTIAYSTLALALSAALTILSPLPNITPPHSQAAAIPRLPPIDRNNPNRCNPTSSAIGQANAARDQLLDLRECDLRNSDLSHYDISGALMERADLSGSKLVEAQMSKAYAIDAKFENVDFTNAVLDRVAFDRSDMKGAVFANAVLSDSTFEDADLEGTDFSEVYIGDFAQRKICKNPTLKGENPVTGADSRASLGCR